MSLKHAAQHLAAHGRGPDTVLVHMTPGEVKSLSDIAMAHGGHLTINPHTGLPEAGFLSSILPMVAGIGLSAISGGAINPMTAGLLVGGVTGVASGSLSKGLMAGMGAYGGAGLGESLAAAGMQEAAGLSQAQNQLSALTPAQISEFQAATGPVTSGPVFEAQQAAQQAAQKVAEQQAAYQNAGFMDKLGTMGKGVTSLGTGQGWSNLATNAGGGMGLAKYGLAAGAPLISEAMQPKTPPPVQTDKDMGQRYTYSPGRVNPTPTPDPYGREQTYFKPVYTPVSSDTAKSIYGYAGGGPVEMMSNANAVGANTGYPMADINKPVYASPYQTPVSANVVHGASDTGINPVTGEMLSFADGGNVDTATPMPGEKPSYKYDPMTQLFSKIESMPSDDQTRQKTEQQKLGGGPQTPMTDAQFAAQKAQGEANAEGLSNFASSISEGIKGLLSQPPLSVQALMAITNALGIGSNGQGFAPGIGPASSAGEAAMSSTGSGNQAAKAAAISAGMGGGGGGGGGNVGTGNGGTGGMGGGLAAGGLSHLGDYSDGGRLLRGPGDGVSDSIPAVIGKKQPARLADGEFVVPARIVSELGNGSTEAGARKLYAMMDRIQKARGSTVGKGKVAKNSRSERFLPA
jgi:hypothetical protein